MNDDVDRMKMELKMMMPSNVFVEIHDDDDDDDEEVVMFVRREMRDVDYYNVINLV
jgi:hypothetical protein